MADQPEHHIEVDTQVTYLVEQSAPEQDRYVFAYTITIRNRGSAAAKLISRHWIITDANNRVEEVKGEGVVGEQPYLRPGESFRYTSGAVLTTPVGSMRGSYRMVDDAGVSFDASIPVFTLAIPRTLH